ncbi:MAG: hypothetical protein WC114_09530 [Smithellaceae bacterium]|nr:hypothetical protein [Dehalococcoidia bacterium]
MSGFPLGEVGPVQVKFDGVDLGYTKGGVTFEHKEETVAITYDQTGKNIQNRIGIGGSAVVKLALANPTLAQLEPLVPGATIDADGMIVKTSVGVDKRATMAKELILTIMDGDVPSTNPEATLVIFKAIPTYEGSLKFDDSTQRSHSISFEALPDDASGNVNALYRIGLPS